MRGAVERAQDAILRADEGDTRALKREAAAGNRFVRAWLMSRGLVYEGGAIHAMETGTPRG